MNLSDRYAEPNGAFVKIKLPQIKIIWLKLRYQIRGGDSGEKTPRSNSIEIIEKIRNLNTVNTET